MSISFDNVNGFVDESYAVLRQENVELRADVAMLTESWDEAAAAMLRLRTEDEGWSILGQVRKDDGFSLLTLKDVAKKSEIQSVGNPLLKRAFELRFNPIFSRGFQLQGTIKPRYQRKLDKDTVRGILFDDAGMEKNERICFNVGNLFLAYNKDSGEMRRIPFEEITNRAVDPDFPENTAYYQRTWTRPDFDGKTQTLVEWYPVVEWSKSGKPGPSEISNSPVNEDWVVIDMRVNTPTNGHWGIPDVFPALPYAWAYSEYIRDASSLLKALTAIAWKVVGKSKAQAQSGGVQLAAARKSGGVAAMTAGTELTSMPRAGQVDMADGVALAAMVASATGVSTSALISVAQGTNAAAIASLDGPTVAMARARQEKWTTFYARVFRAMDIEDVVVNFPKITEDPIHRQVSSLATGRATGAIWADEYREAFLEATSVKSTHAESPDVAEYAQAQNALGFMGMMENIAAQSAGFDPLARRGNSGVSGTLGEIDNTNKNADTRAKSGTQTDLVG